MSRRKDMGSKLKTSLEAEDQSLDERFAKADVALATKTSVPGKKKKTGAGRKKKAAPKVIRDTFSMPPADHQLIGELRDRLVQEHALVLNKSEILRAGLIALSAMTPPQIKSAATKVAKVKAGRPKQF